MTNAFRLALGRILGSRPPALQVGALCVHRVTGQVLLITSRDTGRWIIPKGWPMNGHSVGDAALREAWEEAGVRGAVSREAFGHYGYMKRLGDGLSTPIRVQVHLVEVDDLATEFPESAERDRQWFAPADAASRVEEAELKSLFHKLKA
ncbi:ADP-ribose pyrophosphatase YjhB, NUDIX family [Paracoccus isoporae]|uniref:ADP-ribose pyrophosphatase YjhB, NUDIX family n=1 Tax=Paracoccus isoporae TaxID=591205 RepID=A0A1G6Z3M5_9RHOB|nr:NUDIX hydrolase [Paracoccus isoporae]SDD97364.1 ADP-ribose pyrophosphatase YjhB, NUDIX family [Paracoccus isoporae]